MTAANLYPPIFLTYPILQDSLKVVLFNEKAPTEWDKVSHYLNQNKYINNHAAREILKIEDTPVVSRLLTRWTKQGLLTKIVPREGAKKNVVYRLPATDEKNLFAQGKNK